MEYPEPSAEKLAQVEAIKANAAHIDGELPHSGCPTCGHSSLMVLSSYMQDNRLHYVVGCSKCNYACVIDETLPIHGNVFNIITPCSRPENLEKIAKSIRDVMKDVVIHWHVILDCHSQDRTMPYPDGGYGMAVSVYKYVGDNVSPGRMRNLALRNIIRTPFQWVYFLDDDNCMHPRFYDVFQHMTHQTPMWGFVVSCDAGDDNILEANPDEFRLSRVDMSQMCMNVCLLYGIEFSEWGREEDGTLADKLNIHINKIGFVKEIASYHDGLGRV